MNDRTYAKLFSSIVTSSIWSEDSDTRIVWVTMLAIKDAHSEVHSSIPGLARMANVPLEKCEGALTKFEAPDPYSRTKEFDGRRIKTIPGGWLVLNGDAYRRIMSAEERKEYKRIKEAERRSRLKNVDKNVDNRGQSLSTNGQIRADADTDADAVPQGTHTHSDPTPFEPTKAKPQPKPGVCVNGEKKMNPKFQIDTRIQNFASKLSKAYNRPDRPVTDCAELSALAEVCRRPDASSELDCILLFKASLPAKDRRYFPQSVSRLLASWDETLDRARNYHPAETLSDKISKEVFDDVDRTLRNLERPE